MGNGWRSRLYKTDRARDFDHERDRQVRARQVYETVDRQRFQWIVVLVAGIGFFLDGYTLFAGNFALPMVSYVYWRDGGAQEKLTWINCATLAGTFLGQIVFGILADKKGRKKMYGMELVILIASTVGVVMASTGRHDSMSIFGWLVGWRFIVGIGVGADYPLSAVITSEFAPTRHRARMLATVFFMQPLGQVTGNLVTMAVVTVTRKRLGTDDLVRSVDVMWRWVIGIGVIPGLLAMLFRFAIPETPRFMLEIEGDPVKAEFDTTGLFGDIGEDEDLVSPTCKELESGIWMLDTNQPAVHKPAASISSNSGHTHDNAYPYPYLYYHGNESEVERSTSHTSVLLTADWTLVNSTQLPNLNSQWSLTRADIYQYFIVEKNYRTLLATSLSWFFLDVGFYGIGMSSPKFLARTWGDLNISGPRQPWQISDDPNVSVYDQFLETSKHALVILNLGSMLGGILLILAINHLNRVRLQRWGFLFLAALFIAMGTTFLASDHPQGPVAIALYIVAQTAFNFGPNATTYILPAELFPTRYRATCHGISAAAGKLGSLMMQLIVMALSRRRAREAARRIATGIAAPAPDGQEKYGKILVGFSVAMLLGWAVSLWLPQVQERVVRKMTEEERAKKRTMVDKVVAAARRVGRKGWKSRTLEELSVSRRPMGATVTRNMQSAW